ncbi:MAG: hypothetical protein DI556_09785 [Rhodovulum sulfidophilum]|uniref:Uncharacterized protein n=1 Tax=Rhodovulum sulfidophilum TaxID=35806 RepID=A0A2W5N8F4_RHOSU|nr:MAG: hypothetical protein DI556_09785 [Rhodovulum sulfidophilum]
MFPEFSRTVTGTRRAPGTYVDGIHQPGTSAPISIFASIQPSSTRDRQLILRLLPEGRREESSFKLRAAEEIRTGDQFELYGTVHEILSVEVWRNGQIPHYTALAVRMQAEGLL